MSLASIINIAGTGMSAQTVRLNTTASNLANSNSIGTTEDTTYRAKTPVFKAVMDEELAFSRDGEAENSVKIEKIIESEVPLQRKYQPGNPLANEKGFVYMTNVNPMEELANMIAASRDYQMNVEVMNTTKNLVLRTIGLLDR